MSMIKGTTPRSVCDTPTASVLVVLTHTDAGDCRRLRSIVFDAHKNFRDVIGLVGGEPFIVDYREPDSIDRLYRRLCAMHSGVQCQQIDTYNSNDNSSEDVDMATLSPALKQVFEVADVEQRAWLLRRMQLTLTEPLFVANVRRCIDKHYISELGDGPVRAVALSGDRWRSMLCGNNHNNDNDDVLLQVIEACLVADGTARVLDNGETLLYPMRWFAVCMARLLDTQGVVVVNGTVSDALLEKAVRPHEPPVNFRVDPDDVARLRRLLLSLQIATERRTDLFMPAALPRVDPSEQGQLQQYEFKVERGSVLRGRCLRVDGDESFAPGVMPSIIVALLRCDVVHCEPLLVDRCRGMLMLCEQPIEFVVRELSASSTGASVRQLSVPALELLTMASSDHDALLGLQLLLALIGAEVQFGSARLIKSALCACAARERFTHQTLAPGSDSVLPLPQCVKGHGVRLRDEISLESDDREIVQKGPQFQVALAPYGVETKRHMEFTQQGKCGFAMSSNAEKKLNTTLSPRSLRRISSTREKKRL
jgi:hypothetical protein